jgi:hypothetical protein
VVTAPEIIADAGAAVCSIIDPDCEACQ